MASLAAGQQVSVALCGNKSKTVKNADGPLRQDVESNYAEAARCLHVPQMDEVKKAAQEEFDHISARAQDEVKRPNVSCQRCCSMCCILSPTLLVPTPPLSLPHPHPPSLQISRLQAVRVEMMRKALVQWCEKQLVTARDGLQQFNQHLESFRGMTW